jgi:hypothetical protein
MTPKNKKTHNVEPRLPSYPSMASCAAATGIPKAVQQQAKKGGCDVFDQANRVHLDKLLRWIFRKDADGEENANWPDRLKRAQALKAEAELEKMKGSLVELSAVHEAQDRCCSKAVAVLAQKFETELPPKQDGMPAEKIAEMNRTALDQIRVILSKREAYQS